MTRRLALALGLWLATACLAQAQDTAADEDSNSRVARLEAEQRTARQRGESDKALQLLREIVEAAPGHRREISFLSALYVAERDAGNHRRAAAVRARLLEHPRFDDGARLTLYFIDAQYRAYVGDAAKAREFFEAGRQVLAGLAPDKYPMIHYGPRYRSRQHRAEASILRMEGRLAPAAEALQRAIAANDEDRRHFREGRGSRRPFAERDLATAESDRSNLLSELIGNHLDSGRLGAAELAALDWLAAAEGPEQRPYRLSAMKRHGDVLLASRRYARALETYDRVLAEARAAGRDDLSNSVIHLRRSRAQALMGLGRWEDAYAAFRDLEQATRRNAAAREVLRAGNDRALTRAMAGRPIEAEKAIDNALANLNANYPADHPAVIVATGIKALILAGQRRDEAALPLFARYVEGRGLVRGGEDGEQDESAFSQMRHRLVLESYLALLARRAKSPEALNEAFRVADALRGSRVQQAIAASAARGGIRDPELAGLIREEQDLGAEVAALYRAVNDRQERDAGEAGEEADLRPRLQAAEQRRGELRAKLRRLYPEYDRLVRPAPPSPAEVGRHLGGDEVLLSIYSAPEASYVFAVGSDGQAHLHVAALGAEAVAAAVKRLRAAVDVDDTPLERLPAFDTAVAHQLHQQLLEPLRPAWAKARHLIVSAAGSLGELPFSLLVERPGAVADSALHFAGHAEIAWLVRERAISHVPSAVALVALRRLPPPAKARQPFVGFGDPDFGAPAGAAGRLRNVPRRGAAAFAPHAALQSAYRALPPLPDTRQEVLDLARSLRARPDEAAVLGAAASRRNVLGRDLSRRAVVAFATHGLQPGDLPGLDEPALALALPADGAESPLLTLSDVLGLKLDADWVVLSACNTAGADSEAAEALSGLGRGFFFAGARALLVTHWPVESASARQLVSALFARPDAMHDRAEALRQAQLELMRQSAGQSYSYAHPLFWAPFALVGDGRMRTQP